MRNLRAAIPHTPWHITAAGLRQLSASGAAVQLPQTCVDSTVTRATIAIQYPKARRFRSVGIAQVTDAAQQQKNPPPVRLGRLQTASDVRRAFKRLGDAVLAGIIEPKRANSAMYAVAGAAKAIEIELAERLDRRAERIERRIAESQAAPPAAVDMGQPVPLIGRVIEGEVKVA